MRSFGLFSAAWVLSFLTVGVASAHIDLTDPPQRGGDQKEGPCEGQARGASPTAYTGGETVTIKWTETVEHGEGFFRISLDPSGDSFDVNDDQVSDYPPSKENAGGNGDESLKLLDVPDRNVDNETPDYSAEITLPNIDCDQCTLQLIQMMGDREPSAQSPTSHIYFRCADITITKNPDLATGGAGGMGAGGEGGNMTAGGGGGMASAGAANGGAANAGAANAGAANGGMAPAEPTTTPPGGAAPTASGAAMGGSGTATAGTGGMAPTAGTGENTMSDEGGCAVVAPRSGSGHATWMLALLGLALTWRKRRTI